MRKTEEFSPLTHEERKEGLRTVNNSQRQPRAQAWRPITPVPENTPPPEAHPKLGKPVTVHAYRDEQGQPHHYVYRFENGSNKEMRPCTYGVLNGRADWRWRGRHKLLYNLDKLAQHPQAPVVVVEGEKAADSAAKLFEEAVVTTSPNGAKAADKADWSPLKDREVYVWPDNDSAGLEYAADVAYLAAKTGARSVRVLKLDTFGALKP